MTNTLNTTLLAAIAVAALTLAGAARADEFTGPATKDGANAYLNQQAKDAGLSDPTARDSLRSHGRP